MSGEGGKIWVNIETGKPHGGDQLDGDREATPEEYEVFMERDPESLKDKRLTRLESWSVAEQQVIVMRKSANEIYNGYDIAIATAKEDGKVYVDEYSRLLEIINNGNDPWTDF